MNRNEKKPSFTKRVMRRVAPLALGGTLATQTTCSLPAPVYSPVSNTTSWKIPDESPPDQQRLLDEYKKAYEKFELAADQALIEAKHIYDDAFSRVMTLRLNIWDGINVSIIPPVPGKSAGRCCIDLKSDPHNKTVFELPKLATMLGAYLELCRVQNKIHYVAAGEANLSEAPSPGAQLDLFLKERHAGLPPQWQLSSGDLQAMLWWLEKPLRTACRYAGQRCGFQESEMSADCHRLEKALKEGCTLACDPAHMFVKVNRLWGEEWLEMPTREEIIALQGRCEKETYPYDTLTEMLMLKPPEAIQGATFSYASNISLPVVGIEKEIGVDIHVVNPALMPDKRESISRSR